MSKMKFLLAVFALLLICSGCANQSRIATDVQVTVLPVNTETPKETAVSSPEPTVRPYQISSVVEMAKGYKLTVPQLDGLSDKSIEDALNEQIRKDLLAMAGFSDQTTLPTDESAIDADATFEQTFKVLLQSNDVLSIAYSAYESYKGAAHPNNLYRTFTYDLSTGKSLAFSDCVTADESLIKLIREYQVPDGTDRDVVVEGVKYINENYDDQALITMLKSLDTSNTSATSFWKPGVLGLNLETIHVIGDYVQLELPLVYVEKSIRTDRDVCQKLLK